MRALPALVGSLLLVAFSAAGSADISSAYLAPANRLVYRLTAPGGVAVDFRGMDSSNPSVMTSADGWKLIFQDNGKTAVVKSPSKDVRYEFEGGRIVRCKDSAGEWSFPYESKREAPSGVISPLAFYEFEDGYFDRLGEKQLDEKWRGTNRLCFPDANPNRSGAFYAMLVLLGIALALWRGGRFRLCGKAVSVLAALALFWTGSRGAMLGLAVGLLAFAWSTKFVFLRSRRFWILSAAVLVVGAIWFGVVTAGSITRGFANGGVDWGNAIRLDMWKTAPKMMCDAPGGWGAVGSGAGRAYFDWYQSFGEVSVTGSLMNDHLTVLANVGWIWRGVYLFVWALILLASVFDAVNARRGFPLAVVSSLAVMAWFNPVFGTWTTWIVPGIAMAALALGVSKRFRPWRVLCLTAGALAVSVSGVGILHLLGSASERLGCRIFAAGSRVTLRSVNPSIWVVDDEQGALGSMFVGRDIREFYRQYPAAPAIGYVRDIAALPKNGISRLVLSGKSAQDWLLMLSENEESRRNLPSEVIMISPPFAPSEMPGGVIACCHPKVVVGEFAARFQAEYANPPAFVTVVPSMERYVFGWMRFAIGE